MFRRARFYIGAGAYHAREKHWLKGWKTCWYTITFSYWDFYVDGITRLECGFFGFLKRTYKGMKTEIAVHKYSMSDGAGQIGRSIWNKTYNKEREL